MLHLYLFFHCNLAFSSIAEELRPLVIDRCYSPMLDLAERGIPIGIEATAWTLQEIQRLRPEWMERLKGLLRAGSCEFVGSGYAQIIGPLVPSVVNAANQRMGQQVYERLLGRRPVLALINEQAYSPGILEHYADNGYTGVVMEWDNPRASHPEWPSEYRYVPQRLLDMRQRPLDLLWNQSVVFQHLQRMAHDELSMDDYLHLVLRHASGSPRALCLYGNDAEIFDFRPGRFETEAPLAGNEWDRIGEACARLRDTGEVAFHLPGEVAGLPLPGKGNVLTLESAAVPVPVKKQPKYNLLRWAVTGRDSFDINCRCRTLANKLRENDAPDSEWQELCYLWASDFRTHITEKRWSGYQERLANFERKHSLGSQSRVTFSRHETTGKLATAQASTSYDGFLHITTDETEVRLNLRKGLAVEAAFFPSVSGEALFGTLPHGFFDEVSLAADFFSGHVVMDIPGQGRRTDLEKVFPRVTENENGIEVECEIQNFFCPLRKKIVAHKKEPVLDIRYRFNFMKIPVCVLRLAHVTLLPGAFIRDNLSYAVNNGGSCMERLPLHGCFDQGKSVSFMVSASQAAGMTEGCLEIGDTEKRLRISALPPLTALMPMFSIQGAGDNYFSRVSFSCRECDDTAKSITALRPLEVGLRIQALRPL